MYGLSDLRDYWLCYLGLVEPGQRLQQVSQIGADAVQILEIDENVLLKHIAIG